MTGRLLKKRRGRPLPHGHGSVRCVMAEPDQGVRRGRGRPPYGEP